MTARATAEGRAEPGDGGSATPDDSGAGLLSSGLAATLMAPLRIPERVLRALEGLSGAADTLGDIRSELGSMREQNEPLAELVPLTRQLREQIAPMPPTVERISGQAKPLEELLPALVHLEEAVVERLEAAQATMEALERDESRLNDQVAKLCGEVGELQRIVSALREDVERVTERLPDPAHGPLDKVRDVFTGRNEAPSQ